MSIYFLKPYKQTFQIRIPQIQFIKSRDQHFTQINFLLDKLCELATLFIIPVSSLQFIPTYWLTRMLILICDQIKLADILTLPIYQWGGSRGGSAVFLCYVFVKKINMVSKIFILVWPVLVYFSGGHLCGSMFLLPIQILSQIYQYR